MEATVASFGELDKFAPEPLYLQIKQIIERCIDEGKWLAGQKLPSENELVEALDVSRMTINRALRELTQQGLVNRVHGKGTFVAERRRHASLIELQDIATEVASRGKSYTTEVISLQRQPADKKLIDLMQLERDRELYFLCAVHYQDDIPIQLENRYVNAQLVPDFIQQDFTRKTSTSYLLQQFRPAEMEHIVRAVNVDRRTAELLQISPAQPCLELSRRTWVNRQVVTRAILTYPGNRYDLGARYATNDYELRP